MTLKIYGIPRSRAFRVLWAAEELGLAYENVPTDFNEGVKRPEFLKLNPNARVPVIDDGGFVLFESLAINLYLARRYGAGTLYPASVEDEARAWQWSLWGINEFERALIDLVYNRYVAPPEKRNEALAKEGEAKLPRPFGVLDAHLGAHPHLLGDAFTIADLNVAALMYGTWFNKVDLSRWPQIAAWLDRCFKRPAALKARKLRE